MGMRQRENGEASGAGRCRLRQRQHLHASPHAKPSASPLPQRSIAAVRQCRRQRAARAARWRSAQRPPQGSLRARHCARRRPATRTACACRRHSVAHPLVGGCPRQQPEQRHRLRVSPCERGRPHAPRRRRRCQRF
eukprot:351140-Chlamydomonas_euryale.AAC.29